MAKKKTQKRTSAKLSQKSQKIILGAVIVAALTALAVMILVTPKDKTGSGVGANGFSVFEKRGADLAIDSVVSKNDVVKALGGDAKSVDAAVNSGVMSYNNNLGQTATYSFVTQDGTKGSVDVDVLQYIDQASLDSDKLSSGTGSAGTVNGMEVRYLPAASLGTDREYALLVTKGLKSYKFSMTQPTSHIVIREVKAQDILKQLIGAGKL